MHEQFQQCEICGTRDWKTVRRGEIRDGVFGSVCKDAIVSACGGCDVHRLAEKFCQGDNFYQTEEYRQHLKQSVELEDYFLNHDDFQIVPLSMIWPRSLRNLTVADVGCAGGSFLDQITGVAKTVVGIEPNTAFRDSLASRGYKVFPYASDAKTEFEGQIDFAATLQVIEHVHDPLSFLTDIKSLLSPTGVLLISTPNRRDILMELLPKDYPKFFYRIAHRWYFDADSLSACAKHAGLKVLETRTMQRYGMSNMLAWLRDRAPSGTTKLPCIDSLADNFWKAYAERNGVGDTLFTMVSPAS